MNVAYRHPRTSGIRTPDACTRFAARFVAWFVVAFLSSTTFLPAQEPVKVWEFTPYEVEVWCVIDPSLNVSELAKQHFTKSLLDGLDNTFRAAWRLHFTTPDGELRSRLQRDFETLQLNDFMREELIMVVNRDPANAAVRTLETAIEKLSDFAILPEHKAKIDAALLRAPVAAESPIMALTSKLKVTDGGLDAIIAGLESKSIAVAIVPRSSFDKAFEKLARQIPMLLPWQTDSLLRQRDKIFMVYVGQNGNGYFVKARELDCGLQYFGPTVQRESTSWPFLARTASAAITTAYAPIARVENALSKTAELRLKAGGLVVADDNPAIVQVGDLMHPLVRREGSNGATGTVEALPWTYAAITETDGIKMNANVYAYSGGPGLQGKNNRRTQRYVLRVRPIYPQTDIQVSVRSNGKPQAGCAVYDRDIETEKFTLLGKTDWRGRFTVARPNRNALILPDAIRVQKEAADKKAKEAADLAAASAAAAAAPSEESDEERAADEAATAKAPEPTPPPATTPAPEAFSIEGKTIALRQPLVQLYVKSGDVVLARLPVVPGISPLEKADLADDSRRLEAEAFMRGFQGEILDLIGLRTLLSTRVSRLVAQNKMKEAEKVLVELRGLKDYSEMVEGLDRLQRKVLDESNGPISLGAKSRIDRLFQSTREMMQKFLQNDLVRDAEAAFSKGGQPADSDAVTTNAQTGGDTQCTFAEFSFTLPERFKFVPLPSNLKPPPNLESKSWTAEDAPAATFAVNSMKDPKNVDLDAAGVVKILSSFLAGFTDSSGIKISNRMNPQSLTLAGLPFTQLEWSGSLGEVKVFGFICGTLRGDRLVGFMHVGYAGEQTQVHQEIRRHLETLKVN